MQQLMLACHIKPEGAERSESAGEMGFSLRPEDHLKLEEAQEALQQNDEPERYITIDLNSIQINSPSTLGDLEDGKFRIYLNKSDGRGHFHLVAYTKQNHSLVYSDAAMVNFVAS